jgi:protocatechuate 3,4-dioxygenase beta subunit
MNPGFRSFVPLLLLSLGALLGRPSATFADVSPAFERARTLRVLDLLTAERPADVAAGKRLAVAAGDAAIHGHVRGLDGEGLESAWVMAWPADSLRADGERADDGDHDGSVAEGSDLEGPDVEEPVVEGGAVMRAKVEADGSYRLEQLDAGTYYVSASAKGYETRYYGDTRDLSAATQVPVADGETVAEIDITLERLAVPEGRIAGRVTRADGTPIANAVVHAVAPDGPYGYGAAETDAEGHYEIRGLVEGSYVVEAWHEQFLPRFYGDVVTYDEALRVEVGDPGLVEGIDIALTPGGTITGVVRDAAGGPVVGAYVNASFEYPEQMREAGGGSDTVEPAPDAVGDIALPARGGGWAVTDSNGVYRMGGLPTGRYRVHAQASTRWVYVSTWYDGARSYDRATAVEVILDQETAGIDLQLDLPSLTSALAGRVLDAAGHPVAEAFVAVQHAAVYREVEAEDAEETSSGAADDALPIDPSRQVWAYAQTDADGRWLVEELPAGEYLVTASSRGGWQYVQRWYLDAVAPDAATPVQLADSERRDGIDIVLPLLPATAAIEGRVTDTEGRPLEGAFVQIAPVNAGEPEDRGEGRGIWAYGNTDRDGHYCVEQLPAGDYTVQVSYWEGAEFGEAWYDGATEPGAATPVQLADDQVREGVDLAVDVRPIYAAVSGRLHEAGADEPVGRGYVILTPVPQAGERRSLQIYGSPWTVVDGRGGFRMEWIPEGRYMLTAYVDGAALTWSDPVDGSTTFDLHGGDEAQRDFEVTRRRDGDGEISGSVTTRYDGLLRGVPEPEPVDEDAPTTDASVLPRVADWPPEIAVVQAFPVTGGEPYTTVTDEDGSYVLRGLPAGDYLLMSMSPYHIGTYYDGAYAPDQAEIVRLDDGGRVSAIDFALPGMWLLAADTARDGDEVAGPGAPSAAIEGTTTVTGHVRDGGGRPLNDATVYLLDDSEQPVAFARTGVDGVFELTAAQPGRYRVYAGKPGFAGRYNGDAHAFTTAEPLTLSGGLTEVELVLAPTTPTAVTEESSEALPAVLILETNVPNPFNPETRIRFTVPHTGRAVLRVYNGIGQEVAQLIDEVVAEGVTHAVTFRAPGLGAGIYFYALDFEGQRLARPMLLVK